MVDGGCLKLISCVKVAESKPLVIQADVLQRELESCLRREYTPENLPLLLLQVGVILWSENTPGSVLEIHQRAGFSVQPVARCPGRG